MMSLSIISTDWISFFEFRDAWTAREERLSESPSHMLDGQMALEKIVGSARLAKLVPLHSFGSNDWFMRSGANEMIIFRGSSRGSVSTPQQWKRKKNPTTYENATAYDVVVMYIRCGWRGNRNCKIIFKHLLHKNKNY